MYTSTRETKRASISLILVTEYILKGPKEHNRGNTRKTRENVQKPYSTPILQKEKNKITQNTKWVS